MNSNLYYAAAAPGKGAMNQMETILKILKEANDQIDYAAEKSLIDGGLIDSLELMEIITDLEDAFGIEIGMEEVTPENFNSVEAIAQLVTRLGGKA